MEKIVLTLSNDQQQEFDLSFNLMDNSFVPKWISCLKEAKAKGYPISEPWAMYNLNKNLNPEFVKDELNRLIKAVDSVEPLFNVQLDSVKNQDMLNKIHAIFEVNHGKLDEWKTKALFKDKPKSFRQNLSEINQFVHACETINSGTKKIRVVYFDLPKYKKFTDDDYKLFTNKRNFGSLYHLYCDVGKNLESLIVDNDDHHEDVVPNIHYSADSVIYFSENSDEDVKEIEEKIQKYKTENEYYLHSQGYDINSTQLTTGKIEIAKLDTNMSKNEILDKIAGYNIIKSLDVV